MANKDLEIALRIKADLAQGQRDVEQFGQTIADAGTKAEAGFAKATEAADEQAARIKQVVAASLDHQQAMIKGAEAAERSGAAAQAATANWNATASAQAAAATSTERLGEAEKRRTRSSKENTDNTKREQEELGQLLGRIDPVIRKLDELDDMERQLRAARASGSLDAEGFDHYLGKLTAQRNALAGNSNAMQAATITAGQYKQAMRQLPMQITDITTSLVSGMPIWMVAVQQGGQIRDSFGGIGNAARGVVSLINPMTLALGGIAAAVAATGLAYYQGSMEAERYNEALIMTGNVSGTTANTMNDMAARIDGVTGTQRQAAAALAEIAATGKFTEQQLEQLGLTAVLMANTTGKAVSETTEEFKRLAEDPVKGISELNDKYHFLTLEIYKQIAALQAQGRQTEAVQLALDTFTNTYTQRSKEIADNTGSIERAWKAVKSEAADAWDAILGIGRESTMDDLEAKLDALQKRRASLGKHFSTPGLDKSIQAVQSEIASRKALAEQAAADGKRQRINDAAVAAEREIQKVREQTLSKAEQKEKEIAEYRRNVEKVRALNPNAITPEQQKKDEAAISEKYADKKAESQVNKQATAYENLNRQIRDRIAVLDAASTSEQKLTETQRFSEKVLASLEDGTNKYSEAQKNALRAQLATLAAADQANQVMADGKALKGIEQQLLAAQGNQVKAAALQLEAQYGDLLKRLEARGDQAGAEMIRKLIDVEKARARLAELQAEIERVFSNQARQENSIQTQVDTGLISEIDARKQIVDLHAKTAKEVEQLLPEMERLAEVTKDPQTVENLERMREEVDLLKQTANELQATFKNAFESGLSNSIQGLVKGTQNLEEAAWSFAGTISDAMLRLAADKLANQAFTGLTSWFDGIVSGAAQAEVAMQGVEATKLATDTTMLASGQTAMATQAASSTALAAETTAAWTPAATAASIGSWGTAAAIGLAAVVAALAFKAFADGGHVRGPGTSTSDSIPAWLSNDEFVTRAAVVTQPGALPFLEDFNRRGMSALSDWAGAVRHATGGLAGVPAPDMPSPALQSTATPMEGGSSGPSTLNNSIDLHVYDDPQRIAEQAFNTRYGQDAFFVMLSRNPSKVKSILRLK